MPESNSTTRSSPVSICLSTKGLLVLSFLLLGPWIFCGVMFWQGNHSGHPAQTTSESHSSTTREESRPKVISPEIEEGPWGRLEMTKVDIVPPDELITVDSTPHDSMTWYLPDYTVDNLMALFQSAKLTKPQASFLLDANNWQVIPGEIDISVPKNLILSLSPESRSILYTALSLYDANKYQYGAFVFYQGPVEEWMTKSGLKDSSLQLIKPLIYQRGDAYLFSDLPLVMSDLESMDERIKLMKALTRTSTELVKLRITPQSDLEAIARYWSLGQRTRELESLLRTLPVNDADGFSLDIIHLMPSFARRLLYTFPKPSNNGDDSARDCHWTALNFNKPEIDDSFTQIDVVLQEYRKRYYPTTDDYKFGDLILLVRKDGTAIHVCVHIAGDIVFTKNGGSTASPWIFMKLKDVLKVYPSLEPLDIQHLRARP